MWFHVGLMEFTQLGFQLWSSRDMTQSLQNKMPCGNSGQLTFAMNFSQTGHLLSSVNVWPCLKTWFRRDVLENSVGYRCLPFSAQSLISNLHIRWKKVIGCRLKVRYTDLFLVRLSFMRLSLTLEEILKFSQLYAPPFWD